MALSLSTPARISASARTRAAVAPRPSARLVVRAGLGEALSDIGKGFMTIFSPSKTTVKDWQSTGVTGFKGDIRHHEDGHGRPFKDGVVRQRVAKDVQEAGGDDYLGGAVERLMGHNFTGDGTEPPAGAGSAGWKGELHCRNRDGAHQPRNW